MARVPATNYSNPAYTKSDNVDDLALETDIQPLGQAVDAHDHSSGNGLPTKRLQFGTLAGRPAFGNAGHVYVATDTSQLFIDDGARWVGITADALVTSGDIQDGAVTLSKLADGILTADAAGRAKMQDGYVNLPKLLDGVLSADAGGRAKMQDGYVTDAKIVAGAGIATSKLADFGATYKPMRHVEAGAAHIDYAVFTGTVNSDQTVEHTFVFTRAFATPPVVTFGPEMEAGRNTTFFIKPGTCAVNQVIVTVRNNNNLVPLAYKLNVIAVGPSS